MDKQKTIGAQRIPKDVLQNMYQKVLNIGKFIDTTEERKQEYIATITNEDLKQFIQFYEFFTFETKTGELITVTDSNRDRAIEQLFNMLIK